MMIKELAGWLPNRRLLYRQLCESLKSVITLPFYRPRENGIQTFFHDNYYVKKDGLVFDGTTSGYLSKISKAIDLKSLNDRTIIDLGCGKKTFYYWLVQNSVTPAKYIGIDFSINDESEGISCVVNDDITSIDRYLSGEKNIVVMSNSLCYMHDTKINTVLSKIRTGDEVIILDPSPNFFWDAHFNGIKPIYRNVEKVLYHLENSGFTLLNIVQDYWMKLFRVYLFPLSYCIYMVKSNDLLQM